MSIEDKIKQYLDKIDEYKEIEKLIVETLPEQVWTRYEQLKLELESDKSLIQKQIKEEKTSVEVDGHKFGLSTRSKTGIDPDFMHVAKELGHLDELIDMGVITDLKINADQIQRLDPEKLAIYQNLITESTYTVLRWPKRADV